jgi:hypothetical protein
MSRAADPEFSSHAPRWRTRLETPAWLLRGVSALPGQLSLVGGMLSLSLHGSGTAWPWQLRKLERDAHCAGFSAAQLCLGQSSVLFRERLEAIRIASPWYWFQGGLIVHSAHGRWRISFAKPNGLTGTQGLLNRRQLSIKPRT